MRQFRFAAAAIFFAALTINAQDYNRVGLSYNNTHYGASWKNHHKDDNTSANGIGIDYIHGFSISKKMPFYIETGANINFGFKSESVKISGEELTEKFSIYTISVPVNLAYAISVNDDFKITPYLGLNFKVHLDGSLKYVYKSSGTKLDETYGIFNKNDVEDPWNRFQMGWHVGVGFQYKPVYLGLSWGTDFIKPVENYNSKNFSVALGYMF